MGRKPLPEHLRKVTITFRFKKNIAERIKRIEGYNPLVEKLIDDYLQELEKNLKKGL